MHTDMHTDMHLGSRTHTHTIPHARPGLTRGVHTMGNLVVSLPGTISGKFNEAEGEEGAAGPAFTEVDPEPFELYDSQVCWDGAARCVCGVHIV